MAVTVNEYVSGVAVASIRYWAPNIEKKLGAFVVESVMLITELDGVCVIVGNSKPWVIPVISID